MPAHDLHADGQAVLREAAGHRDGRVAGNGDIVARAHPVYVGVHLYAVDLCYVRLHDVEGRVLAHREDHELVGLHEPPHVVEDLRAFCLRVADLQGRELQPLLHVPDNRVLELIAVLL